MQSDHACACFVKVGLFCKKSSPGGLRDDFLRILAPFWSHVGLHLGTFCWILGIFFGGRFLMKNGKARVGLAGARGLPGEGFREGKPSLKGLQERGFEGTRQQEGNLDGSWPQGPPDYMKFNVCYTIFMYFMRILCILY